MAKEKRNSDTISTGAGTGDSCQMQMHGGQRPGSRTGDAQRIAELEREVQKLRRAYAILKMHFLKDLGLDFPFLAADAANTSNGDNEGAADTSWFMPPGAFRWTEEKPVASPPRVVLRALGPIEAEVSGRLVDLGAPKQRSLLTLLASRVGQPVPIDVIVEELWTGHPPPSAITSLQAYVANLRRALEPDRAPRAPTTVLRTRGRGYFLDSRVVEVDVNRFGERAAAGRQALDLGDPQQALSEFEAGLALWRGPAYAEVADSTYVVPETKRVEELRLSAIEGRCAALLGVGAHEMAVADLEAFTEAYPLREYGHELLSLALYRAGRQADALAALRANQKRLSEELGIDPGPALRRLERAILIQDPVLDWHPPQSRSAHGAVRQGC
jgi:DNA-binding SARP family transcriptional activator